MASPWRHLINVAIVGREKSSRKLLALVTAEIKCRPLVGRAALAILEICRVDEARAIVVIMPLASMQAVVEASRKEGRRALVKYESRCEAAGVRIILEVGSIIGRQWRDAAIIKRRAPAMHLPQRRHFIVAVAIVKRPRPLGEHNGVYRAFRGGLRAVLKSRDPKPLKLAASLKAGVSGVMLLKLTLALKAKFAL